MSQNVYLMSLSLLKYILQNINKQEPVVDLEDEDESKKSHACRHTILKKNQIQ
jgi:hypothetical protein